MALNSVSDWSTTAASNVDVGGVGIQGSSALSSGNDAIQTMMAQLKTFFSDSNFTLFSTDAGAAAAPVLNLYRNSATPAASDVIGKLNFQGEDSAGNTEDYADIQAVITDPTSTSEDATLQFRNKVAGTMRATWQLTAGSGTLTSFDAGASSGPTWQLHRNSATPAAADVLGIITMVGQDDAGNGHTYAQIYGVLDDPANGSEDGSLGLQLSIAGSLAETALFGANGLTLTSADAGATAGPLLQIYRNSSTPAVSDIIGSVQYRGKNSSNVETIYADIFGTIIDPTNTSEDGSLTFRVDVAGTLANRIVVNAAGVQIVGSNTNDSAASTYVGEFVSSNVTAASGVSLTTATAADVTSISLTAGDWDVEGTIGLINDASNSMTSQQGWISSTSATLPSDANSGAFFRTVSALGVSAQQVLPVGRIRMSLAATTTVYLSARAAFSGGGATKGFGYISARRVR